MVVFIRMSINPAKQLRINARKLRNSIAAAEYIKLTPNELNRHNKTVQTHRNFGSVLTIPIIDTLLHLFDDKYITYNFNKTINHVEASHINTSTEINNIEILPQLNLSTSKSYQPAKITNYILEELNTLHINTSFIKVTSMIYGYNSDNTTLLIEIMKNGQNYIHFTLHLAPTRLNANKSGSIHFKKNVYHSRQIIKNPFLQYALIKINWSQNKPDSLIFSLVDEYTSRVTCRKQENDAELQIYMEVILRILNRLFDEDNIQYYVGYRNILLPSHQKNIRSARKYK